MFNYSIIIPHYNIPKLLERCVNSVPDRDDVQIIVIDDCSPKSEALNAVTQYLSSRRNIEMYTTDQSGSAGRARNLGMTHAKGKWLIFADADDFFDKSFDKLLDSCVDATEDIIYFRTRSVMSDDINKVSPRVDDKLEAKYFNHSITDVIERHFRIEMQVPWGKIIKRNFVETNHILFDETRYANDAMFAVLAGCKADSIKVVNQIAYVLTDRPDSLCANFFRKPGEAGIRAKVALRVNKVLINHGYSSRLNDANMFLKLAVLNHDFSDLKDILRQPDEYGITRSELLKAVKLSGRRYYPLYLWLKFMSFR